MSLLGLLTFWTSTLICQPGQRDTVRMMFGGDVNFAVHFEDEVGDSIQYPFEKMQWFKDADVAMVNLENPITTRGIKVPKEFNFRCLPKYTTVLRVAGIDIVNLGNNHIYDYGDDGVFDTIHFLDSAGVKHVGAGMSEAEARRAEFIESKGLRLAFLGYLGFVKTSSLHSASDISAGPAVFTIASLKEDIGKIRDSADVVIVNIHWGVEKSNYPGENQIRIAHEAIEAGADVVVGHHPHVLQGIERYRSGIIAYSLGNFIFGGNSRSSYTTGVLEVDVPVRSPRQLSARLIPVQVQHWQASMLDGVDADELVAKVKVYSSQFRDDIFGPRR